MNEILTTATTNVSRCRRERTGLESMSHIAAILTNTADEGDNMETYADISAPRRAYQMEGDNSNPSRINLERGDGAMTMATYDNAVFPPRESGTLHCRVPSPATVEDLAFVHWQYNANEKAYESKLITKTMYEYARDELRKSVDKLSKICYSVSNGR